MAKKLNMISINVHVYIKIYSDEGEFGHWLQIASSVLVVPSCVLFRSFQQVPLCTYSMTTEIFSTNTYFEQLLLQIIN